jgi:hypothetical protein
MPKLTLDAIRKNPSAIFTHSLPKDADPLLLEIAYLASEYIRETEFRLMLAARSGAYTPAGWKWVLGIADVHEHNEAISINAECVGEEIATQYERSGFGFKTGSMRLRRCYLEDHEDDEDEE